MVVTFDTLKFVEALRDAGVPQAQAKAMSQTVREAHATAELASDRVLREATMTIGAEIQALRAELPAIELRLAIWLGGIVVMALGAFTALSVWIARPQRTSHRPCRRVGRRGPVARHGPREAKMPASSAGRAGRGALSRPSA